MEPLVYDVTEAEFEARVIHRSQEVAVLVDFWAPWCGPCRVLGPLLEKLAQETPGRFEVAKVNVDENQQLAGLLQVQSIPSVKLVVGGQLAGEFSGALPEPQLRQFLDHYLPPSLAPQPPQPAAAETPQAREARFLKELAEDPKNNRAKAGLGQALFDQGRLEEAQKLAGETVEDETSRKLLEKLRAGLFFAAQSQPPQNSGPLAQPFQRACGQMVAGDPAAAMETFLSIVAQDRKFMDDGGRKALVHAFAWLEPGHPLTAEYRKRLSRILFA